MSRALLQAKCSQFSWPERGFPDAARQGSSVFAPPTCACSSLPSLRSCQGQAQCSTPRHTDLRLWVNISITSAHRNPMSRPNVGVIADLDGVVVRGPCSLPGASDAVSRLLQAGLPVVFVTNSGACHKACQLCTWSGLADISLCPAGHTDEQGRSSKLAQTLGVPVGQDNMLVCHSSVRV